MLIFDEKKYAQELLKNKKFNTYRQKDIERYILIRYLYNEGMSFDDIKCKLSRFPIIGCEYLDKKDVDIIYNKIIEKAISHNLVYGIQVTIYKSEMDIINNLDDNNVRKLLFILLVYYKWALQQNYLFFYSKYNNCKMVMVNDLDCWKYANLMKLRISERYKLCKELIDKGLYVEDNFKSHNYFYIPFCANEGDIAFTISNYDNILGEMYIYNNANEYKRCCICGTVINKTRSPKKYCSKCAYKEKRKCDKKRKNPMVN